MDFCDNQTIVSMYSNHNTDGIESQVQLYTIFVPILLVGCLLSVLLNSVLVAVGTMSKSSIRSRSPILVLSLNLAATDGFASFLIGLGLVLNSILPVVLNVDMKGNGTSCTLLVIEILRLSALIASALHLLAMAMVHYKGIVNPLHYRSVIFCSQHRTRSIYLMTFFCWFVPALVFASYFSSIPCQGFQIASCRSDFILTFRFRLIVVISFFIPLLLMSILYIRIFAIIKRHQAQRAIQRQQSCQISTRSRMYSSHTQLPHFPSTPKHSSLLVSHSKTPTSATDHKLNGAKQSSQTSECQSCNEPLLVKDNTKPEDRNTATASTIVTSNVVPDLTLRRQQLQRQQRFNSMMVTAKPEQKLTKTIIYREHSDLEAQGEPIQKRDCFVVLCLSCCKYRLGVSRNSSSTSTHTSGSSGSFYYKDNITNGSNDNTTHLAHHNTSHINEKIRPTDLTSNFPVTKHHHLGSHSQNSTRNRLGQTSSNVSYEQSMANTGHAKALVTTLLILGTYLLCWMPAVVFYALTCIDHCPFPITTLNYRWRIIISFFTNGLVILKAFVDPFIYTYRMKEMKSALNRCFSFLCPSFVMALCPPVYDATSSRYSQSQQNSFSRSSVSCRGQSFYPGSISIGTHGQPGQLCRWSTRTTSWGGDQHTDSNTVRPNGSIVIKRRIASTEDVRVVDSAEHNQYELKQLDQLESHEQDDDS